MLTCHATDLRGHPSHLSSPFPLKVEYSLLSIKEVSVGGVWGRVLQWNLSLYTKGIKGTVSGPKRCYNPASTIFCDPNASVIERFHWANEKSIELALGWCFGVPVLQPSFQRALE